MTPRITNEEFVSRAKKKHGDKYDYTQSNYKGKDTPILITCPKHGQFRQRPANHWKGAGYQKCRGLVTNAAEFIEKASEVHGGKFSYEFVNYKNNNTKVTICCPAHGNFEQDPRSHLYGTGCRKCANEERRKNAPPEIKPRIYFRSNPSAW